MTQVVKAKDARDVVEGVIDAATTIVMDGAGGYVSGEAGLKKIVKTQADIKSSTGIGKGPGKPSLIKILDQKIDQVRTAQRIGNRVVKVGTPASATQQNAHHSTEKSTNSHQSQQESGTKSSSTGTTGNENRS